MVITLILTGMVIILLIAEALAVRRSVDLIPLRIHVTGTRGKSTITAYIAAALRASGKQVQGKVTGEIPALILADGSIKTIRRRGPARIQEQFQIIRRAARSGAEALVLECMSIDPSLQETESRYFRPLISVLSNIRDDHREKAGGTRKEQVAAMCRAIPAGCTLVTTDLDNLEAIRAEAEKKQCRLVVTDPMNKESLNPDISRELPPGIFPENIALAVEVAVQAGMPREEALKAILEEIRKIEAGKSGKETGEGKIRFLNAFSVNDPQSATAFLDRQMKESDTGGRLVLIFNTRSDRPMRTDQFVEWITERKGILASVCITGDHRARAYTRLRMLKPGVEVCKISARQINGLSGHLSQSYGEQSLVMGIGNIKGEGYRVIKEFER